ncbi:replicative DNA helicase [Synechocystis sp. PCC 7339]|uniref:replicative DNA helicase n=1 Tax=unclassified Synechocystis TaxID=2640012 RepID=UPI001BAF0F67|nr:MULTISPECIES: replicative DNA helicase [unclassified Synechocystis]QUS60400.1 replicative DNA helicase [Synechocystis sp. PCC 7338]UAJ72157.1 replicative DNA helicase [Synechocystis sp. PCC 7339]
MVANPALPPQNIEAEEYILGGILLDPEAIGRIIDLLVVDAFYVKAHRLIYESMLSLHGQSQPTDLMSVSSWLQDHHHLEAIGGMIKLTQLLDRTISAANIDRFAVLVMDKYLRRQLIAAGHDIVDLGYETSKELEVIFDESEQKIFRLTQSRPQAGLVPLSETLVNTFIELDKLHEKLSSPGVETQFYDLDAMTGGLQRADLIILAGRPSMGKCCAANAEIVLANGRICTIAEIYKQKKAELLTLNQDWKLDWTKPSDFIDDGIKPVFRVTTRLGRSLETTLAHPYLTIMGWQTLANLKVGDKIAVPRHLPCFGNKILNSGKVKLLAYLIGDGDVTGSCPRFTNINPRIRADFEEATRDFPGIELTVETSNNTRTPTLRISKNVKVIARKREIFGENLNNIIKIKSLKTKELASKVKVSIASIDNWKKGYCFPEKNKFKLLCQALGVEPSLLLPPGAQETELMKNGASSIKIWLEELGVDGKTAHTKIIPDLVFRLEKSLLALFLNRLFATDGWASILKSQQIQLGYCSVSEKLARQVQHLLLRFSIIAKLKRKAIKYNNQLRNAWQLDITDAYSIKNFIEQIGIFDKEEQLIAIQSLLINKNHQTNCDLIPIEVWEQLKLAKENESWSSLAKRSGIINCSNLHVGKRSLTRGRLLKLSNSLANVPLQQLATGDIYWDEIVSIESVGLKQVYDLTVPETHNFIANDICVHNTAFGLGIAANIAKNQNLPVAIFSLEMSKEQLALRLLASESLIDSNRLRTGHFSQAEFEPLTAAMGTLSSLPIYIDDTASISVTQMRSQVRRLQSEQKGPLGMVLIDYLQLMEGGSDNRVQELSKITRSLKGLAREINAPVIALSQLSRAVESRTNKRPMMSDLRESGCISGDSLVNLVTGKRASIRDLVDQKNFEVWAINEQTMKLESAKVSRVFCTGKKLVYILKTRLGRTIKATANHKFLTIDGWKRLDELSLQEHIALPRKLESHALQLMSDEELGLLGHLIGDGCTLPRHAIQYTSNKIELAEVNKLSQGDIYWDTITSITEAGVEEVFDLTVPGPHNFVANDIIVHNSIEQDADLIMMIYRDEYYNPDTPDPGVAELLIVKHRNGPTGVVKLLFKPEFTQFLNLQQSRDY